MNFGKCNVCPVLWAWAKMINHEKDFHVLALAQGLIRFIEICDSIAKWQMERDRDKAARRKKKKGGAE